MVVAPKANRKVRRYVDLQKGNEATYCEVELGSTSYEFVCDLPPAGFEVTKEGFKPTRNIPSSATDVGSFFGLVEQAKEVVISAVHEGVGSFDIDDRWRKLFYSFIRLFLTYVRPYLEYAIQSWSPWTNEDKFVLERVQMRAVKMVSGLKGTTYEERLSNLGMTTLETRRVSGDMIENARFSLARTGWTLRVVDTWNSLPDSVKQAETVNSFKNRYNDYMKFNH